MDSLEITRWTSKPKDFEISKSKEPIFGVSKIAGNYEIYLDDGKHQISISLTGAEYRIVVDLLKKSM